MIYNEINQLWAREYPLSICGWGYHKKGKCPTCDSYEPMVEAENREMDKVMED